MIRLRVLGSLDVRDDDARELGHVMAQPKRLALLAYLAAAMPPGLHRRDRVLALFWPELDEAHARDALNSAVRFLRRGLGNDVIVTRGEEIGIDAETCWCDATAMRHAIAAGRYAEALSLYRGDLLAGFFLDDAPTFDEWLERERTTLRIEASRAAGAMSEQASRDHHVATAVSCARRAFELAPDDERALRHLLHLLDHVGDRVGAVQTYESYARRVSVEYDVVPAPETQALIERIRGRDTAHASPSNGVGDSTLPATRSEVAVSQQRSVGTRLSTRRLITGGFVIAASTLVGLGAWLRPSPGPTVDANVIAVLPFRVTGPDSSLNYLREGIIDLANAELIGDGVPRPVDSRTMLARARRELPSQGDDTDPETAIRLARQLGAIAVGIEGAAAGIDGWLPTSARPRRDRGFRRPRARMPRPGGEARDRLRTMSDSAEAVRAYLAGMAAFREGR